MRAWGRFERDLHVLESLGHLAFLGGRDRPVDAKAGLAGDVHRGAARCHHRLAEKPAGVHETGRVEIERAAVAHGRQRRARAALPGSLRRGGVGQRDQPEA